MNHGFKVKPFPGAVEVVAGRTNLDCGNRTVVGEPIAGPAGLTENRRLDAVAEVEVLDLGHFRFPFVLVSLAWGTFPLATVCIIAQCPFSRQWGILFFFKKVLRDFSALCDNGLQEIGYG